MIDPPETRNLRNTEQFLLPLEKKDSSAGKYDIYPSLKIEDNKIFHGFDSLAEILVQNKRIIIDGYVGVFFDKFRETLNSCFETRGIKCNWYNTSDYFKPSEEILRLKEPFLGGDDPLFGKRSSLELIDFLDLKKFSSAIPDSMADLNIIIGPGASLAGWDGLLVYIDIPKNEIQFRARAGSITNLGAAVPDDPKKMYKSFYFVDWIILNRHKEKILPDIDLFVDAQRYEIPVFTEGDTLRGALTTMARNLFRVRPWFEPGAWGGSWIKQNIEGLNKIVRNYAWSFELITPENGLLIESDSLLLEASFDMLMYQEAMAVLGDCYHRYGTDFPIRFDFLDTFDGGNLSLQCHPGPEYIKENFGESFPQEETYYILDCRDNSGVYLGFTNNIDKQVFRDALFQSFHKNTELDTDKYIMKHPSKKHDLFLIPYGTIHGSGNNNLVLEISSTPYIFTFKMYDWLRPDLDGKPRPLNIERGLANLNFERKGNYVRESLIARPEIIKSGPDWQLYHLATHETHSYDVMRYHFKSEIVFNTDNKCLVMSLTEGKTVEVHTENGIRNRFSFAETFVIPAAAGNIRIINLSDSEAILVYAFVK